MNTIRVHFYDSTGEAYDTVQCSANVKNGDILIIPSEKVVGLADTWPVAITKEAGHLHTLADGNFFTYVHQYGEKAGQRVFTDEQIDLARRIARQLGYELQ
ncbi:hypothetical protein [Mesorhizobium sp. WSM2239]|uniref:Phage protein n=2 Tax=unclassified Mesorhizobium TaxID=325217 RepID=A0AAU8DGT1_9HYPH